MALTNWKDRYLRLAPDVALKNLEIPYVYHIGRDELYEIDETAAAFLLQCDGTHTGRILTASHEFVEYCISESILEVLSYPDPIDVFIGEKTVPSLRYLELQLTHRCNLSCAHCYLGSTAGRPAMAVADAAAVVRRFSEMGGLRLLISGGEPLVYKGLKHFLKQISGEKVRRVLLTNGTLINAGNAGWLDVDEIQFSLDGWEKGHDRLRGKGAFDRTMEGVRAVRDTGIDISFSTMIHACNVDEFETMASFIQETGAVEWGVDALCMAGVLLEHEEFAVDYETCAGLMEYGFGGGYHGSSEGFACGRHLMTVMPDGSAAKCGFYMDAPVGNAIEDLAACWSKIVHIPLSGLECRDCAVVDECRGGCRFRAPGPLAPDPLMCRVYGVSR